MAFAKRDDRKNTYQLHGPLKKQGYDWWWHSFTGVSERTGKRRSFFVEFFTVNPALGTYRAVLGQDPENKARGLKPSYLMVKAGAWGEDALQLNGFYSWAETNISESPLTVRAGDCLLTENRLKGKVSVSKEQAENPAYMSDAGTMEFDLHIQKIVPYNVGYGTCPLFRKLNAFEMYWHASGIKSEYRGTVILNGETYKVIPSASWGYADKNWGSNFTSPWVWLSSNHLYSRKHHRTLKNSVFDIGGGCPKVFGIPLKRKLLSAFYYEGSEFEFNFSKFWTFTRTKFDCKETEDEIVWHVCQWNLFGKMVTDIRCKKSEMLFINYEDPLGRKRHNRLWNGGNGRGRVRLYRRRFFRDYLVDDILVKHAGCEYGEMDP